MLGGPEVTMDLLNKKFDFIFFTGSTRVGKIVMGKAAEQMTPVSLQLGGKSPCIVDDTCNLKNAAMRIVRGKFLNCGQSSLAPELVLVDEKVCDRFLFFLKKYITEFYGKEPIKSKDYGRIINMEHFFRLLDLIEQQELVIGGEYDTVNMKIEPTVVIEQSLCSDMMKTEIFGPILPILPYRTWEEAVDKVMRFHHAPAAYLFTKDKSREDFINEHMIAGSVCINDVMLQASTPYLPMGGVGNSGTGKYHGKAGFDLFSNIKSVMKRGNQGGSRIIFPPYRDKLKLLKRIMK
jgi:aldehyde dehydrogenase (NAD+)